MYHFPSNPGSKCKRNPSVPPFRIGFQQPPAVLFLDNGEDSHTCELACLGYDFRAAADENAAPELILYGDIASETWWGDEVTPLQFTEELNALGNVPEIVVRINSGGGDVFAANAIYTRLKDSTATITVKIDGWAASAATIIAAAGDKVLIARNGVMMYHDPAMNLRGYFKADELEKQIAALAVIKNSIVNALAIKTGKTEEEVSEIMKAETWYTGAEAVENGFADELTDEGAGATYENRGGVLFVNSVSMGAKFDKAPEFVRNRVKRVADIKSPAQAQDNQPAGQPGKQQEVQDMDPKDSIKTVDDLRKAIPRWLTKSSKRRRRPRPMPSGRASRTWRKWLWPGAKRCWRRQSTKSP